MASTGEMESIAGVRRRDGKSLTRVPVVVLSFLALAGWGTVPGAAGSSARELARAGKEAFTGGDLDSALTRFREARETLQSTNAKDYRLIDFLAVNLYNLGVRLNDATQPGKALECFTEGSLLAAINPRLRDAAFRKKLIEATLSVADYVLSTGGTDRPVEAYRAVQAIAGRDARPFLGLGSAYLASGDLASAAEALGRAEALDPNGPGVAAGLGRVFEKTAERLEREALGAASEEGLKAHQNAVDWFRRARDLEPTAAGRESDLAGALVGLSGALMRAGRARASTQRLREAGDAYRRAVSLSSDSPWREMDLALFLFGRRLYDEARKRFAHAGALLGALLDKDPGSHNAPTWEKARTVARENRAAASYNLAIDSLNRAEFDKVNVLLGDACDIGPAWRARCEDFRRVVRRQRAAFEEMVASHEATLARHPDSAADLLALGDLYANLGAYDKAAGYFERLRAIGTVVPGLDDRIAAVADPGDPPERRRIIKVAGGQVDLVCFNEASGDDLEKAVKAAWLRVSTALGPAALRGTLAISVYRNKRAFRENAGYRVGGMVKGNYSPGHIRFFETPSQTVLEWISVLTHEMSHHAVQRLTRGVYPRWFSEGVARYVQGDAAVLDRDKVRRRLDASPLPPLEKLDDLMERSWNDPDVYLQALDASLLAVEQMVAGRGLAGLRRLLVAVGAGPADGAGFGRVVEQVLGSSIPQIDKAWRNALRDASPAGRGSRG